MLIHDFIAVFRLGNELANAETWKRRQNLVNALVGFLGASLAIAAAFGHPVNLDQEGINHIAGAIAAVVGLFNIGATVATTTRIGLPPRGDAVPTGRSGAESNGSGNRAIADTDRGDDWRAGGYASPHDQVPYLDGDYRG